MLLEKKVHVGVVLTGELARVDELGHFGVWAEAGWDEGVGDELALEVFFGLG